MRCLLIACILLEPKVAQAQTPVPTQNLQVVPWETEQAQVISAKAPIYPRIASIAHVEGCVYLVIAVSTSGTVQEPTLIGGLALMSGSAMAAAGTWKFKPSAQNVETVARVCYFLSGDSPSKLIGPYQKAVDAHPNDPAKLVALARYSLQLGVPNQAEAYFRRALSLKPSDPDIAFGLGDSLVAQGDLNAALVAYQLPLKTGNVNGAIKQYKNALNEKPPVFFWAFLYYSLGQAFEKKGDTANALKQYKIAMNGMPQNQDFREAYDRLAGK